MFNKKNKRRIEYETHYRPEKKMKKHIVSLPLAIFFLTVSMTSTPAAPLKIQVSILPQKFFVEKIAGDLAEVDVLVKPGKSPATYAPTPSQIKKLSRADLYLRIGVPFENGFMHKIESVARNIRIADLRKGIRLRKMKSHIHEESEESHEHDGHHHEGMDPHIWMSPRLVKQQAETILNAIIAIDPGNTDLYRSNFKKFISQLEILDGKLGNILKPYKGENIFVFHPVFGYFADDYGLNQIPVETMGKSPKGKDLAALIKLAKKEKTRVIFVQPQFDSNAARKIAASIKGHVMSVDPLAYDYINNMERIAEIIAGNLKP